MPGSLVTPNLGLVYPDPTDVTVPFDYVEYLNANLMRLDNMKMVGGMGIFNASCYIDSTTLRFKWEDIVSEAVTNGWMDKGIVVFFPPGNYLLADSTHTTANIELGATKTTSSLTLIGTKGSVIKTSTIGNTITDMVSIVDIDNVVISGLTFVGNADNSNVCTNTGIRIFEADNVLITDCTFRNLVNGIMIADNVSSRYCKHVWIKNNRIIDFFLQAIRCDLTQNVWIEDNHIEITTTLTTPTVTTNAHAIEYKPGTYADEATCFITGNTLIRPRRNGIHLTAGVSGDSRTVVERNTIDQPGYHANYTTETTKATRGSGIYSTIASVVEIKDNFIRDAAADGIYAKDATSLVVSGNTVRMFDVRVSTQPGLHGIDIADCDYAVISDNVVYNGYTTGVLTPAWAGGSAKVRAIYLYSSDNVICKDNRIQNWQIETNTCLLLTMQGNVIKNFTAASAEYLITNTGSTLEYGPVADQFISANQFSILGGGMPGSTNQASYTVDDSFFPVLQFGAYNTASSQCSRGSVGVLLPKKVSNNNMILKFPLRSMSSGYTASFDIAVDSYDLDATGTQAAASVYTVATTASAGAWSNGPNIMSVSVPVSTLPASKSVLRIGITRKDTAATVCHILGMYVGVRDTLSGENSG